LKLFGSDIYFLKIMIFLKKLARAEWFAGLADQADERGWVVC
jgi:hypothetical protein